MWKNFGRSDIWFCKNPIKREKMFFLRDFCFRCVYYKITFQKIEKWSQLWKKKRLRKNKYARKFREKERKYIETGNTKWIGTILFSFVITWNYWKFLKLRLNLVAVYRQPLASEKEEILSYVAEHKKITRKETEALLNIGTTKAYRILKELSSAGKLHINGSGKNVYYTGE